MEVIGMRLIKRLQDEKNKHTKAAKELAEDMTKLPEVDEKKQHFFNMDVEDLSAKVLYATNTKTAVEALEQIAQLADEPALAASIKNQYRQLTEKALELAAPSERLQLKQSLGRLYDERRNQKATQR